MCILGPYNSGTNLMQKIFEEVNGHRREVDRRWGGLARRPNSVGGGKHTLLHLPQIFKRVNQMDKLYIVCFRKPHSWLYSTGNGRHYKIRINSPDDITFCGRRWKSLVQIYNEYYTNYMELIRQHPNVISVEYSKIIAHGGLEYLNNKIRRFGVEVSRPHFFRSISNPRGWGPYHAKRNNDAKTARWKEALVRTITTPHTKHIKSVKPEILRFFRQPN